MAEIVWTPDAQEDLRRIEFDASRYSAQYGAVIGDRIHGAVQLLSDFPEMGRRVPGFRSRDIRQLIVRNHLVTYRLVGNEVRILEVKGGGQTTTESDFR